MLLSRVARAQWPSIRSSSQRATAQRTGTHTSLWRHDGRLACTPAYEKGTTMAALIRELSNDAVSTSQLDGSSGDEQRAMVRSEASTDWSLSSPRSRERPRKKRTPPKSLADYLNSKDSLSVTNLTAPLWCEYAFQYGILGMTHLPIQERPKTIVSIEGKTIRPDRHTSEKREKVLEGGRKVHEKLERELYPVKVYVETKSREDDWALRLLKLIVGVEGLRRDGCCRELPVFGFVHGKLVFGMIDEISRRPLSKRLTKYLDADKDAKATANTTTLLDFYASSQSGRERAAASPQGKRWSTQEEWKREKRKSEALAKSAKASSPAKKKAQSAKGVGASTGQASLTSFFTPPTAGTLDHKTVPESVPLQHKAQERFGYFLEDSKTRYMRGLPEIEDQLQARLQCMLYKRMFDGILAGFMNVSSHSEQRNRQAEVLELDEYVTPIRPAELFAHVEVNPAKPMSDIFLQEASQLTEQYGLEMGGDCTLDTFVTMLRESLAQLSLSAREGLDWQQTSPDMMSGALQPTLRLTYRTRRDRFKRSKGKYNEGTRRVQPSRAAKHAAGEAASGVVAAPEIAVPLVAEEHSQDMQIATALEIAVDAGQADLAMEEEILRDNGVVIPLSSPSVPLRKKEVVEEEEAALPVDKNIIGTVDFYHNAAKLDAHLIDVMKLWNGQRPMRGVTLEQSWRCTACEFRQDCEWREAKQKEIYDGMVTKGLVRADIPIQLEDGEATVMDACTQPRIGSDDENALWSQFDDIDAEDLKW